VTGGGTGGGEGSDLERRLAMATIRRSGRRFDGSSRPRFRLYVIAGYRNIRLGCARVRKRGTDQRDEEFASLPQHPTIDARLWQSASSLPANWVAPHPNLRFASLIAPLVASLVAPLRLRRWSRTSGNMYVCLCVCVYKRGPLVASHSKEAEAKEAIGDCPSRRRGAWG
jgi:hypothetical protein